MDLIRNYDVFELSYIAKLRLRYLALQQIARPPYMNPAAHPAESCDWLRHARALAPTCKEASAPTACLASSQLHVRNRDGLIEAPHSEHVILKTLEQHPSMRVGIEQQKPRLKMAATLWYTLQLSFHVKSFSEARLRR